MGGMPEEVTMTGGNVAHQGEAFGDEDDMLFVNMQFSDNRYAVLEWGSAFHWPEHYVLIQGTKGAIKIDMCDCGGTLKIDGSILGNIDGLNINIGELLNLVNAYVPTIEYAGVKSDNGFTVTANKIKSDDTNSGSAGGFIGYGSGVQVSHCDVTNLKHTKVTPPKLMMVTLCRVQMEMSRLSEDLSDMQILQECQIVQQETRQTRKSD